MGAVIYSIVSAQTPENSDHHSALIWFLDRQYPLDQSNDGAAETEVSMSDE